MNINYDDNWHNYAAAIPFADISSAAPTAQFPITYLFFDGEMPDLMEKMKNLPTADYTLAVVLGRLGFTEDRYIGALTPNNTNAYNTLNSTGVVGEWTFLNSQSTNVLTCKKASSPTVCLAVYKQQFVPTVVQTSDITWAAVTNGSFVVGFFGTLMLLSAGDESSDAEIRILGGALELGKTYRVSDWTFKTDL